MSRRHWRQLRGAHQVQAVAAGTAEVSQLEERRTQQTLHTTAPCEPPGAEGRPGAHVWKSRGASGLSFRGDPHSGLAGSGDGKAPSACRWTSCGRRKKHRDSVRRP